MRRAAIVLFSILLGSGASSGPVTTADLTDAAGDVQNQTTSDGKRPPFDVVRLQLTSDGKNVLVTATLKDPPGSFASTAVTLYFDTDNKKSTGVETFWSKKPGFEFQSNVDACIKYSGGASACVGAVGGKGSKIESRFGVADVSKFGANSMEKNSVRSVFDAVETPLEGKVVRASIPYADLGVKAGGVVRIVARESDGPFDETADFPDVLLKLK
jgi:hypothetical protein